MEGMRCACGGIILADTEDWEKPCCYNCWQEKIDDQLLLDRTNFGFSAYVKYDTGLRERIDPTKLVVEK